MKKRGPGVLGLVVLVVADHVADVLAHEALDALAELLAPLHVDLHHAVAALGLGTRLEGGDGLGHLVVEGDVGHQVADDRERLHGRHRDRLALGQRVHAGHAHEAGQAVDLGRARAALARLAVPAAGQVGRVAGLDAVDHVEHHLTLDRRHHVVREPAALVVAPPDPHRHRVGHQCPSSKSTFSSAGISGRGSGAMAIGAR